MYCGMTGLQKEYYARVLSGTIRDTLVSMGIDRARDTSQINMVMNLRKVCYGVMGCRSALHNDVHVSMGASKFTCSFLLSGVCSS